MSYFGPVRNPWNLEMIAGGSSGGSAAAVAMDNCYAALGTDTGGSIRTPSAMCGVTGFKPTYGRVSIRGIVPLTWSLDHCGPIARTVEDTAMVLQVIAGYDRLDLQASITPCRITRLPSARRCRSSAWAFRRSSTTACGTDVASALEAAIAVLVQDDEGRERDRDAVDPRAPARAAKAASIAKTWAAASCAPKPRSPALAAARRGGRGGARAVDYIHEWRALRLVRRTVDDEVFRQAGSGPHHHADHPRGGVEHRRGTRPRAADGARAQSEARQHALAGRLRLADHHGSLRVFEKRHAHRPADQRRRTGGRWTFWLWRTPISRPRTGTRAVRH